MGIKLGVRLKQRSSAEVCALFYSVVNIFYFSCYFAKSSNLLKSDVQVRQTSYSSFFTCVTGEAPPTLISR